MHCERWYAVFNLHIITFGSQGRMQRHPKSTDGILAFHDHECKQLRRLSRAVDSRQHFCRSAEWGGEWNGGRGSGQAPPPDPKPPPPPSLGIQGGNRIADCGVSFAGRLSVLASRWTLFSTLTDHAAA